MHTVRWTSVRTCAIIDIVGIYGEDEIGVLRIECAHANCFESAKRVKKALGDGEAED